MIVNALTLASENQKEIISAHYGRKSDEDVSIIKTLYNDLGLPEIFSQFEDDSFSRIEKLINTYKGPVDPDIFHAIKNKLYRRNV